METCDSGKKIEKSFIGPVIALKLPINTTVIVMPIALISYYNVLFVMLYPGGIQKDRIVIIYQTINIHDFPLNFLIPLKVMIGFRNKWFLHM